MPFISLPQSVLLAAVWITASVASLSQAQTQVLTPAQAPHATRPDFSWRDAEGAGNVLDRVRLANGDVAQVATGPLPGVNLEDNCELARLEIRNGQTGQLRHVTPACDDRVRVVAAYPSANNAKVAIVATNCGGTICRDYNGYFVVFLDKGAVRFARVGSGFYSPSDKPTTFSFWFNGDDLHKSTIGSFYGGERNALGDLMPSSRYWIGHGEYVDQRFGKSWLKFIGGHPEALLADSQARAGIVRRVRPEQFRALRDAMSGPGNARLVNGRYLVLSGCMRSNCPYQFGSVVVDGFTGDLHVMTFTPEEKRHVHVFTRPLKPETDSAWLEAVDTQDVLRLSIKAGALKVEPVSTR